MPTGDDSELEPPWWQGKAARRGTRTPLSRQAIVEAAVRIVDAEGVDALTIRRLGQELDTGAASLYWHITGKEQLGELVWDHILGEIPLPPPDPTRWQEQIRAFARDGYELFRRHNDACRLSLGTIPSGPNGLRMIEWLLALLRGAGIPDEVALNFGDLLGRYIDASVLDEGQLARPDAFERMTALAEHLQALPPDRFPNLVEVAGTMFGSTEVDRFGMGLDILIQGLEAYLPTVMTAARDLARTKARQASQKAQSKVDATRTKAEQKVVGSVAKGQAKVEKGRRKVTEAQAKIDKARSTVERAGGRKRPSR